MRNMAGRVVFQHLQAPHWLVNSEGGLLFFEALSTPSWFLKLDQAGQRSCNILVTCCIPQSWQTFHNTLVHDGWTQLVAGDSTQIHHPGHLPYTKRITEITGHGTSDLFSSSIHQATINKLASLGVVSSSDDAHGASRVHWYAVLSRFISPSLAKVGSILRDCQLDLGASGLCQSDNQAQEQQNQGITHAAMS